MYKSSLKRLGNVVVSPPDVFLKEVAVGLTKTAICWRLTWSQKSNCLGNNLRMMSCLKALGISWNIIQLIVNRDACELVSFIASLGLIQRKSIEQPNVRKTMQRQTAKFRKGSRVKCHVMFLRVFDIQCGTQLRLQKSTQEQS